MATNYSQEFKDSLITKMASPGGRSATTLSREVGISQSTLSRWLRDRATLTLTGEGMKPRRLKDWSAQEKLDALLKYQVLGEEERGKFLREMGLHEAGIERLKQEIVEGLKLNPFGGGKKDPRRKQVAALEREVERKNAALAEAAALLLLKKKADLIWGKVEDER